MHMSLALFSRCERSVGRAALLFGLRINKLHEEGTFCLTRGENAAKGGPVSIRSGCSA